MAHNYTITASGSSKATATTEVTATPTDIPAKGTKLAPVTGVALMLDQDEETITVSWTEPAAGIPGQYQIQVWRDGSSYVGQSSAYTGETSATINWSSGSQTEGEYTAQVTANPLSGSYYKSSDVAVSAGQRFETLFYDDGYGFSLPSINNSDATAFLDTATSTTIAGFYATISFGSFTAKPGVTYSVERAAVVDAAGNAGTYAAVTLSTSPSTATALPAEALTADVLGNLPVTALSTVYDRGLPATGGEYKYRIEAVKGSVTQTEEISTTVTADPYTGYSGGSLSIGIAAATGTTTKTYAVTPALTPKGLLQAGDKLVFYYVKGGDSDLYQTGPYIKSIEFSKAEIEAATVVPKNLVIPKGTGDDYAYVQAYIELADGSRQSVSSSISSGGGVSSIDSYTDSSWNYIYYATLSY